MPIESMPGYFDARAWDTLLLIDDDPMLLESLRLHFEEQSQGRALPGP